MPSRTQIVTIRMAHDLLDKHSRSPEEASEVPRILSDLEAHRENRVADMAVVETHQRLLKMQIDLLSALISGLKTEH